MLALLDLALDHVLKCPTWESFPFMYFSTLGAGCILKDLLIHSLPFDQLIIDLDSDLKFFFLGNF